MKHFLQNSYKHKNFTKPVVLLLHMNSSVYGVNGFGSFKNLIQKMYSYKMKNFHILPILTSSLSVLPERIQQVKKGIEKISNENKNAKVDILCYSMASLPLHGYIHEHQGSNYVNSVLFLASPNK